MKNYFLIFLLLVACSCVHTTKKQTIPKDVSGDRNTDKKDSILEDTLHKSTFCAVRETYIDSPFDGIKLVRLLFAPVKMEGDTAYWRPDADARFNMCISEDSLCHTNIDTIFDERTNLGINKIVIFTTMPYDLDDHIDGGHYQGANYGAAKLVYVGKRYRLDNFERNFATAGSFGNKADSIWRQSTGNGSYLLAIESSYVGTGAVINTMSFYEFNGNIQCLLSFDSYNSNDGMYDTNDINNDEISRKPVFMMGSSTPLKIITKHKHYDSHEHKFVVDLSTRYYRWNEELNGFEKE